MNREIKFSEEELDSVAWVNIKGQEFTTRQVLNFPDNYLNNIFNMVARGGGAMKWKMNPEAQHLLNKVKLYINRN